MCSFISSLKIHPIRKQRIQTLFIMNIKIKIILSALLLISCNINPQLLQTVFTFPETMDEISAVEVSQKSDWIWTLEDRGNSPALYAFNKKGQILNTLLITDVTNQDWEDLTSDPAGNLYIGDFGNNDNQRQDLCIYKIAAKQLKKDKTKIAAKVSFYFPEQRDFPPKKTEWFYDVESFFILNDTFYLFTKNRSSAFDGTTLLYSVPNKTGKHAAQLISTFKTCDTFKQCAITSADCSDDRSKVALLSSSHIWLFTDFKTDQFFTGKVQQIDLENYSQKEGLCFVGNNKLYITDERKKNSGGNLYQLDLDHLKP